MGNLGKIGKPQKSKKHKKLKPVDPFNRGGRQAAAAKASHGTDKTPKASQIDDQEMTRSMRDFIRSKKMVRPLSVEVIYGEFDGLFSFAVLVIVNFFVF